MTERILCVEDDADASELVRIQLHGAGYQVVTASGMVEGLRLARGGGFALHLIDSVLPDGDGIELCEKIRAFDRTTPIVFHSARAYEKDREAALRAGAQAYVVKPIAPEELQYIVDDILGKRRGAAPGG